MSKKKSMTQIGNEMAEEHVQVGSILTHDEHIRGTALSLACRYYVETIVKDGDLYREMVRDNRVLKPATYIGVLEVSVAFEKFIRGELSALADSVLTDSVTKEEIEEVTESDRTEVAAKP